METENGMSDQLRVASFAVYLKPGDDSFVKKLMESESSKNVGKDGEIGVFGAERYFNMTLQPRQLQVVGGGGRNNNSNNPKPLYHCNNSSTKTPPSINYSSSESSWTTQSSSTFLKTNKLSTHHNNKLTRRGFFAGGLSCYKSCNDTKSIYTVAPPCEKSLSSILEQPQFSFPAPHVIDQHRPSLEVFGSKTTCNNNNDIVAMNLERKLSVLTWDAIPTRTTAAGLEEKEDEDMMSEASSDLFEIQTISAMPPCMYAPSEASIEWSVVTASAPDFSDYKLHPFNLIPSPPPKSNFSQPPKPRRLLAGCNNHKSVQILQPNIPTAASSPQLKRFVGTLTNK